MEHLAELIFKEFYQKPMMDKTGMKITSSSNGFIQVLPNAQMWSDVTDRIRPSARVHNVQLQSK